MEVHGTFDYTELNITAREHSHCVCERTRLYSICSIACCHSTAGTASKHMELPRLVGDVTPAVVSGCLKNDPKV